MPVFGLDISHHQDLSLDLARCKREGISFVFIKATEGSGFTDSEFASNLAEARAAGLLVAAYHYVRSNASAAAQVAHIQRVVPKDVPVIPDVEANSGGIALTRDIVSRLKAAGYRVPLLYLPRWYWQQIGSPSLAGLPPLWSSRYPDNVVGTLTDEWADVPAHYWQGYGGLDVAVLQFTSSARIAGHQPLDANAYRGTIAQLAALLGSGEVEDDMTPDQARKLDELHAALRLGKVGVQTRGVLAGYLARSMIAAERVAGELDELEASILAAIKADATDAVDVEQLAGLLRERLGSEVADELAHRLAAGVTS